MLFQAAARDQRDGQADQEHVDEDAGDPDVRRSAVADAVDCRKRHHDVVHHAVNRETVHDAAWHGFVDEQADVARRGVEDRRDDRRHDEVQEQAEHSQPGAAGARGVDAHQSRSDAPADPQRRDALQTPDDEGVGNVERARDEAGAHDRSQRTSAALHLIARRNGPCSTVHSSYPVVEVEMRCENTTRNGPSRGGGSGSLSDHAALGPRVPPARARSDRPDRVLITRRESKGRPARIRVKLLHAQ